MPINVLWSTKLAACLAPTLFGAPQAVAVALMNLKLFDQVKIYPSTCRKTTRHIHLKGHQKLTKPASS